MHQPPPGSSCLVSAPMRKSSEPAISSPTCSLSWACSGTALPGSNSIRLSVTRSPWTARAVAPAQICCGPSESTSEKALTQGRLAARPRACLVAPVADHEAGDVVDLAEGDAAQHVLGLDAAHALLDRRDHA